MISAARHCRRTVKPPAKHRVLRYNDALQSRTFLGLRELLFGAKKSSEEQDETAKKLAVQQQPIKPTANQTLIKHPGKEKKPMVGSLDVISYAVGKIAKLADGAVLASCGRTVLLTTVVSGDRDGNPSANAGSTQSEFLPLTVDFRVKSYAVGLIPDNQKRHEFTGSDEEVLQSRVVDRAIRPLFPRDYCESTQVLATVQSYDPNNDPLVVAVNSTSAVLSMSDIPWNGPVGCVRVVEVEGQLVVNPTSPQREAATMDVLYAGTAERAIMVEASGDEVTETRLDEALDLAHAHVISVIEEQKKLAVVHGKTKRVNSPMSIPDEVWAMANELGRADVHAFITRGCVGKIARQEGERKIYRKMIIGLQQHFATSDSSVDDVVIHRAAHDTFQRVLRERVLGIASKAKKNRPARLDGRSVRTVRPLEMEAGLLPMAHGSSLFARGETQTLCSVTLGPLERGIRLRGALHEAREQDAPTPFKHAILHYEFPPFCVNETGRVGGFNRRMIGHGALAEKAVLPVLPSIIEFPHTIRMTSEVVGSDGSSSMATVCGVSLALMDAGVPVRRAVAGIAVGLITAGDPFAGQEKSIKEGDYQLITDILGSEDHYGDMDLKVAGTTSGVTALQLDVKLPGGIPISILKEGLREARQARLHVLRCMSNEIAKPHESLKFKGNTLPNVSIECLIPTNLVGALIGVGGSNIRNLESRFNVLVSIVDRREGIVRVVGAAADTEEAQHWLQTELVNFSQRKTNQGNQSNDSKNCRDNDHLSSNKIRSSYFRKGERYTMRVTQVMDFGAILESSAGQRGFVHISELTRDKVYNIYDIVSEGQEMEVQCLQDGVSGKMSRRVLLSADENENVVKASNYLEMPESTTPRVGHHHTRRASTSSGAAKRCP